MNIKLTQLEELNKEKLIFINGGTSRFEDTTRVDSTSGDSYPTKKKDWTWEN